MNEIVAFIDNVGRTIVGRVNEQTKTRLTVDNPAIVNINVQQDNGQISVQLLPFIFAEFVHESVRDSVSWSFNKQNIVISSNIKLDDRILQQYVQIIENPQPPPAGPPPTEAGDQPPPEPVKLFDDE